MNSPSPAVPGRGDGYTRFRVGRGLALVFPPTFVLVDPANGAFGERLWSLMEEDGGVDALLEELSAAGLRSLGDFAMAQLEENQLRIVVRGQARAVVQEDGGSIDLEAGSVKTWIEAVFDNASGFVLSIGEPTSEPLTYRMERGIAPADLLRWDPSLDSSPQLEDLALDWIESFEPTEVGKRRSPGSVVEPAADRHEDVPVVVSQAVDPEPIDETPETDGDDYDFDALYGRTVAKSVQGAAVAAAIEGVQSPDSTEDASTSTGESEDDKPESVPGEVTLAAPSDTSAPSGLIDAVPPGFNTAETSGSGVDGAVEPEQLLGDHDGRTISAARLRELRDGAEPADPARNTTTHSGPTVRALLCSRGHPNPTHLASCRVCGEALSGSPILVRRPSLGRLVFSTGRTVELDRPAIIGRGPKAEGNMPNEIPQLVVIEGDDLLSRSHAIIRLESWHVQVEDLGSRNGTLVTLPGREPRRLMVGEPVMLESGAVIEFSDEVSATYHGIE